MVVKPANAFDIISDITSSLNASEREEYDYYAKLGEISIALVEYRNAHCMTQKQLSDALGVSQAMVSKYESGDYNISLKALNHIAHKLGMNFVCALSSNPVGAPSGMSQGDEMAVSQNLRDIY